VRALDPENGDSLLKEVSATPAGQFTFDYLSASLTLDPKEENRISPPLILEAQEDLITLEFPVPGDSIDTVGCLVDKEGCILYHTRPQKKKQSKSEKLVFIFSEVANEPGLSFFPTPSAGISEEEALRRNISMDEADYSLCAKAVPPNKKKVKQCR
jgi:hypothetical protein